MIAISDKLILRLALLTATLIAVALCCALLAGGASAATYTVDNTADSATPDACTGAVSDCTLRGAINSANGNAGADVIDFEPSVTSLSIETPLPDVTEALTIDGASDVVIAGNATYEADCAPGQFAIDTSATQVQVLALAIHSVCGRAIKSPLAAPTIQIGPRRADDTVSINGSAPSGAVDIFRADDPAEGGEGLEVFDDAVPSVGGGYNRALSTIPGADEYFSATAISGGVSSTFSGRIKRPADLTSPTLLHAVATSNYTVRLDFDEPLGSAVAGVIGAVGLSMGGVARPVTNVDVIGNSLLVTSLTMPWATGEAGMATLTGNGRVTDATGNEVLGQPAKFIYAGPGELTAPEITMLKASPPTFCIAKTRRCTKRAQTYLLLRLTKPSKVAFRFFRASSRKQVLRFSRRLPAGTSKLRLLGTMSGRRMPAGRMVVQATAEDFARNLSAPIEALFKTVTRNSQF